MATRVSPKNKSHTSRSSFAATKALQSDSKTLLAPSTKKALLPARKTTGTATSTKKIQTSKPSAQQSPKKVPHALSMAGILKHSGHRSSILKDALRASLSPFDRISVPTNAPPLESEAALAVTPISSAHAENVIGTPNHTPSAAQQQAPLVTPLDSITTAVTLHGQPETNVHREISTAPPLPKEQLPTAYGKTSLILIPRDPYGLYASWEFSRRDRDRAARHLKTKQSRLKPALRLHEISNIAFNGSNANHSFDIEVGTADNWYINLWSDNATYCAELGFKGNRNRFFTLARSNTASTPRATHSSSTEVIWADIRDEQIKPVIHFVDHPIQQPPTFSDSPEIKESTPLPPTPRSSPELEAPQSNSDHAPQATYTSPSDVTVAHSNSDHVPQSIYISTADMVRLCDHQVITGDSRMDRILPSCETLHERQFLAPSGAALPLPPKQIPLTTHGSSENLMNYGGSSECCGGGSSDQLPIKPFWLQLEMSLHIKGTTASGAQVWFCGNPIAVAGDGSFSLQLPLPEGTTPLHCYAQAPDNVQYRAYSARIDRSAPIS